MDVVSILHFARAWISTRLDLKSDRGAAAVEYGVLVALIAAVIILAVTALGTQVRGVFCGVVDTLNGSAAAPASCA